MLEVNKKIIEEIKDVNLVRVPKANQQINLNVYCSYTKGGEESLFIRLKYRFLGKEYYVIDKYGDIEQYELDGDQNVILKFNDLPTCDNILVEIIFHNTKGNYGNLEIKTKR